MLFLRRDNYEIGTVYSLNASEQALFEEPCEGQLLFEWSSTLLD